jgi:hypothetical protein
VASDPEKPTAATTSTRVAPRRDVVVQAFFDPGRADPIAARRKTRAKTRWRYYPLPRGAGEFLWSDRPLIVALCDPKIPRKLRLWMLARLVDEIAEEGKRKTPPERMTSRDRAARIREATRAAEEAGRSVRRAWQDPRTGIPWRSRPCTWPPPVLFHWWAASTIAGLRHKRYTPKVSPRPRTGRRPLGPPRQKARSVRPVPRTAS